MQINRLFEIIYLLMNHGTMTAKQLAEHFEVSSRTIYRDIDTLSGAGIPIYACQGKGGGIRLLSDYILNKSLLSEQEQNEILFALESLHATNGFRMIKLYPGFDYCFKNKILTGLILIFLIGLVVKRKE